MVLSDIFKGIFSRRKPRGEENDNDVGITGLPRNIEKDFLNHREEEIGNSNGRHWQEHWNQPAPQFEIYMDPGINEHQNDQEFFNFSHDLFHQLDEMMKGMFHGFERFSIDDSLHDFEQIEDSSEESLNGPIDGECDLRGKMLKKPHTDDFNFFENFKMPMYDNGDEAEDRNPKTMMDWSWSFPFGNEKQIPNLNDHKDHDFDSEIKSGKSKLNDILDREANAQTIMPKDEHGTHGFSFGSFSSTVTKKMADGIIESQKTVKDSKGNEEVTVIRKIGDQTHKKIIVKDSTGNEEVKEDLLNMDEGDLEKFEEAWSKSKAQGGNIPSAMWNKNYGKDSLMSGSLYESIKDLFSPWKRDE